jgi:PadR family transcriptional regulator, regulatory protein AphA
MLKFAILGFLTYSPMTGYDIKQRMDRSTTHFWHAKLSQIYTTLKMLEQENCVKSLIQEQTDRPDKRVFTITTKGRTQFADWLKEPYTECSPKKETLVLKMFFAAQMERDTALSQLQVQLDIHKKQLTYYQNEVVQSVQQAAEEFPMLKRDAQMWEATRRFGEMYEEIYVRWIEEMIQDITVEKQAE